MMKKSQITLSVIIFGIACVSAGIFYSNVLTRKNQSIGEANNAKYEDKFTATFVTINENTVASLVLIEGIADKWRNAIDVQHDFNSEIRKYLEDARSMLKQMDETNYKIIAEMQELKKYPVQYKEAYETLLELYETYSQIYLLAQSPSGSLMNYNSKMSDLSSQFYKVVSKLKIYMPKLVELEKIRKGEEEEARAKQAEEELRKTNLLKAMEERGELERKYYPSGKLFSEKIYKNGKADWAVKEYYESGQLKSEGVLKSGGNEKFVKEYYANGQLRGEEIYRDGKIDGQANEYYENGKLWTEQFYKNGKEEGLYKGYYEDGQLESEGTYRDGELEGLYKMYYKNGKLRVESFYKNGKLVNGTFKMYDENGKLRHE